MSETATVEQLQTEQPAVQTPEPTPAAPETQSLRQHAEKYGHDKHGTNLASQAQVESGQEGQRATDEATAAARARDDQGRFAKAGDKSVETAKSDESKRHARKDIATPDDVPRIRELIKQRTEREQRIVSLEAELAQYRAQVAQPQPQPGQPVPLQHAIARPDVSRPALTDAEFYQQYPEATVGDFVRYRAVWEDETGATEP